MAKNSKFCCPFFTYQEDRNEEVAIVHCTHNRNPKDTEGNCYPKICPLRIGDENVEETQQIKEENKMRNLPECGDHK